MSLKSVGCKIVAFNSLSLACNTSTINNELHLKMDIKINVTVGILRSTCIYRERMQELSWVGSMGACRNPLNSPLGNQPFLLAIWRVLFATYSSYG